jgi:hypothetical protein
MQILMTPPRKIGFSRLCYEVMKSQGAVPRARAGGPGAAQRALAKISTAGTLLGSRFPGPDRLQMRSRQATHYRQSLAPRLHTTALASLHQSMEISIFDCSAGGNAVVLLEVDKAHDLDLGRSNAVANNCRDVAWRCTPCNGANRSIFKQCAILCKAKPFQRFSARGESIQ